MSNRPNPNASKPTQTPVNSDEVFDADALLKEFEDASRSFELKGERFTLPAPTTWPDGALEAANSGDIVACSKLILGDDDYERFTAAGGNSLLLQNLVEKLHGATLGESSASSRS